MIEGVGQWKIQRDVGNSRDRRQFRREHELRLESGGRKHGVQKDGPIRGVAVAIASVVSAADNSLNGNSVNDGPARRMDLATIIAHGLERFQLPLRLPRPIARPEPRPLRLARHDRASSR